MGLQKSPKLSGAPTISDVARQAGVSVGTVSNFLNGTAKLAPETHEAVELAVDELGYVPNFIARSLRAKSTMTLGLVVPDMANPFFTDMAVAMDAVAHEHGYQLMLQSSGGSEQIEARQVRTLLHRRVDGAVIVALEPPALPALIKDAHFPVVCIDRRVPGHRSITTDNRVGGRLALQHLVELGHRQIGLVIGDDHIENVQERVAGAREVLQEHGLDVTERLVVRGPQALETGLAASRLWDAPDPPTAVFATNDIIAMGIYRVCRDLGLSVPEDVSIVGFDDVRWTELVAPALTTVHQDVGGMVTRAFDVLLHAVNVSRDGSGADQMGVAAAHEMLSPSLTTRESTAPRGRRLMPQEGGTGSVRKEAPDGRRGAVSGANTKVVNDDHRTQGDGTSPVWRRQ